MKMSADNFTINLNTYWLIKNGLPRQVGHKLEAQFKQPIVDDKFEYINPEKKSDGYTIKNGKKKLNVGTIAVVNRGVKKTIGVKTIDSSSYSLDLNNFKYTNIKYIEVKHGK